MSYYIQLLGTDVPNSYGGCCFYGPMDYPAFQSTSPSTGSSSGTSKLTAGGGGGEEGGAAPLREHSTDSLQQQHVSQKRQREGIASTMPATPTSGSEGYLFFNCPEGTQRFSSEANIKLTKVKAFLLTRWGARHFAEQGRNVQGHAVSQQHAGGEAQEEATATNSAMIHKTREGIRSSARAAAMGAGTAVMGLPGLLFTINDAGVRHTNFFGPSTRHLLSPPTFVSSSSSSFRRHEWRDGDKTTNMMEHTIPSTVVAPISAESKGHHGVNNRDGCKKKREGEQGDAKATELSSSSLSSSEAASTKLAGMEAFLCAMRRYYFTYRPMTFRMLQPCNQCNRTHALSMVEKEEVEEGVESNDDGTVSQDAVVGVVRPAARQLLSFARRGTAAVAAASAHHSTLPQHSEAGGDGAATAATTCLRTPSLSPIPLVGTGPLDEVCALPRPPRDKRSAGDGAPFIVAVMPLSAHSAVVAFRVSSSSSSATTAAATTVRDALKGPQNKGGGAADEDDLDDTSGMVFGYAIVTSLGPSFDAQRAKALGVKPGPKYFQLKEGMPVYTDVPLATATTQSIQKAKKQQPQRESECDSAREELTQPRKKRARASRSAGVTTATSSITARCPAVHETPLSNTESSVVVVVRKDESASETEKAVQQEVEAPEVPRLVQPYEVMRATIASRHAYVSLVLDGDSVEDVQVAVERLLGRKKETRKAPSDDNNNYEGGEDDSIDEEGDLVRALRQTFPQLVEADGFCEGRDDDDDEEGEERAATNPFSSSSPSPASSHHRQRTLVLRSVVHVQPLSFFLSEDASIAATISAPNRDGGSSSSNGTDSSKITTAQALTRYTEYIFANVSPCVQLSCTPMLSFTGKDVASLETEKEEEEEEIVKEDDATRTVAVVTRHLFTGFVQSRFSAFPTALTHRYHLNYMAPLLFPVADAQQRTQAQEQRQLHQGKSTEKEKVYWPYSLKLRCVPDGAMHWWSPPRSTAAVGNTVAEVQKGSTADTSNSRVHKNSNKNKKKDGGGAASSAYATLIRYPTPSLALAMLSKSFLERLQRTKEVSSLSSLHRHRVVLPEFIMSKVPSARGMEEEVEEVEHSMVTGGIKGPPCSALGVSKMSGDNQTLYSARHDGGGALVFLGTGSAVPSKYRNVSGTYLELHLPAACFSRSRHCYAKGEEKDVWERGIVILDFGEGSAGQLAGLLAGLQHQYRSSGSSQQQLDYNYEEDEEVARRDGALKEFLLDIVLVFISHGHADHHLGLLSLLTLRHMYLSELRGAAATQDGVAVVVEEEEQNRLLVVCPEEVYQYIYDTWGTAHPYCDWLYRECTFEIIRPDDVATAAEERRHMSHAAVVAGSMAARNGGGGAAEAVARDSIARREQQHQRDEQEDRGTLLMSDTGSRQAVARLPQLQALCSRWNACMEAAVDAATSSTAATHALPGCAVSSSFLCSTTASPSGIPIPAPKWDAEVFEVDHPADAHALLLRFPYCDPSLPHTRGGSGGKAAATVSAATEVTAETERVLWPNTSKVFLFSGDTRPSSFLVDRCRRFCIPPCADDRSKNHHHNNTCCCRDGGDASRKPQQQQQTAAESVFVCLHEATFGPGYEAEALRKRHSTLPEALGIGEEVGAAFTVLNHFSQRYPKLPGLTADHLDGSTVDLHCRRKPKQQQQQQQQQEESTTTHRHHVEGNEEEAMTSSSSSTPIIVTTTATPAPAGEADVTSHLTVSGDMATTLTPPLPSTEPRDTHRAIHADALTTSTSATPDGDGGVATQRGSSKNVCFAFDLMRIPFAPMQSGGVSALTPSLVRLLEEYESWGVGTTQRMREA